MKCLLVHNFYQQRGGEDAVFEAERDLLAAGGHDIEDFTLHNDELNAQSKLTMLSNMIWNAAVERRLGEQIARFRPDIVHVHNTFPMISPAALSAARRSTAGVVMTLHNYRLLCPSANLFRDGKICEDCIGRVTKWPAVGHGCYRESPVLSGALAMMLAAHQWAGTFRRSVDRFIALSDHSRALFVQAGIPAEKIVVKPNFVPAPVRPAQFPAREPFALFVGRLVQEKGLSTLLQAWTGPAAPAVDLLIVGEGPLLPEVLAAGGRVRYLGKKTKAEVYDLMRRAQVLVFPSEWYEPFGLVVIEAFANELPVIAADIGAARELIDLGRTGFLFPPGDALRLAHAVRYALESPEALIRMGLAVGQEYRARYMPARNLRLLEAIYDASVRAKLSATKDNVIDAAPIQARA